jgi:gliding motility-associated protein GldM
MASSKETPRQKMIGMMYLVLTALLALNVSDQVLKGFITVDEGIDKSNIIIGQNNKQIEQAFKEYVDDGNLEAKPYYEKCVESRIKIERMITYIDSMKYALIISTQKTTKPDTSQIRHMIKLDDFDTPTYLFIGDDETDPKTSPYSASDLRKKLTGLSTDLNEMINEMVKDTMVDESDAMSLKEKTKTIVPSDRNVIENDLKMNWELDNFYNIPTAAVLTNFDKMKTDLKNVESELFRVFAASSNKYLFKVDKLQAKVLAPSSYVLSGETFRADILLSASSTQLTPDRMKVLVGAEYDEATKKLTLPGSSITVSEGIGKYQAVGSTTGEQKFKGVIEYKNPKGTTDYYPFESSYMVAAPFSAVAADNMNVMYIGVDNPISASAAGFAPTELVVKVSGCGATLKSSGAGKYIINASSTGTCVMTVMAQTPEGLKQQGPPKVFRVKSIPPPVAKINGKPVLSSLEMKPTELSGLNSIGAVCVGFEFPTTTVIKEATIVSYDRNGNLKETKINSAILTPEAKSIIAATPVNKRVFIENIKVSINGQNMTVPDVIIKKKP